MKLSLDSEDFNIIGLCLEGFLCGLYSGIFSIYLQDHWTSNKGTNKKKNIVFYALCALYVLSVVNVVLDITFSSISNTMASLDIALVQGTIAGCADFIAQSILIYRCWIVWGRNICVVILPSISAIVFLVTWLVANSSQYILSDQVADPVWANWLGVGSVAMSITVNALVTGLIIFKLFNVYREVKSTSNDHTLGATGGSRIRTVIFMLIESGMMLFSMQLALFVVTIVLTDMTDIVFDIIVAIYQMLNGITPTIMVGRTFTTLSTDILFGHHQPPHSRHLIVIHIIRLWFIVGTTIFWIDRKDRENRSIPSSFNNCVIYIND